MTTFYRLTKPTRFNSDQTPGQQVFPAGAVVYYDEVDMGYWIVRDAPSFTRLDIPEDTIAELSIDQQRAHAVREQASKTTGHEETCECMLCLAAGKA